MLDKKTIRRLKKRLQQEQMELSQELNGAQEVVGEESLTNSISELSAYDNHLADLGSETFEREKDLGIQNAKKVKYLAINEALERLEEGKYGICLVCGRPIDLERLEVLPQTLTCIECQQHVEAEGDKIGKRPIEEEILANPFARTFTDDEDKVAFDGEDAWQAVARYGTSESPQDLGGNVEFEEMYSDEPRGIVSLVEGEQVLEEGLDEKVIEKLNSE
jgi:YteA family regulatory protein